MGSAPAPWELAGECVVALARRRGGTGRAGGSGAPGLPPGFRPVPGPVSIVGGSFTQSPVGAYLELAVSEPARAGGRLGTCVTTMVVDSPVSRLEGRLNWGFPKELGRLAWSRAGDERILSWEERRIELRAVAGGRAFPVVLPLRSLQQRADGVALVPARLRGWAHLGRVELVVPEGDPLSPLAGSHWGMVVSGACLVVRPARRPTGLGMPLRAPKAAPEPALSLGHQGD